MNPCFSSPGSRSSTCLRMGEPGRMMWLSIQWFLYSFYPWHCWVDQQYQTISHHESPSHSAEPVWNQLIKKLLLHSCKIIKIQDYFSFFKVWDEIPCVFSYSWNDVETNCLITDDLLQPLILFDQGFNIDSSLLKNLPGSTLCICLTFIDFTLGIAPTRSASCFVIIFKVKMFLKITIHTWPGLNQKNFSERWIENNRSKYWNTEFVAPPLIYQIIDINAGTSQKWNMSKH